VEGYLAPAAGGPTVMIKFSDTSGIANLKVVNRASQVAGNGTPTINFSAAVTLTFTKDGKNCTYTGPVSGESQRLITVCED
jgi:hypothetical protein